MVGSLAGVALIWFATDKYGIGLTPDSVGYIEAGAGMPQSLRSVWAEQPPFYPVVLAVAHLITDGSPYDAARIVNALAFGVTIMLTGLILRRMLPEHPLVAPVGVVLVLVSLPLLEVFVVALSEPVFICLSLMFLLSAAKYSEARKQQWLILMALSAGLAAMTRYIGVILPGLGLLVILRSCRCEKTRSAIDIAEFLLIALAPLSAWWIRNWQLTGTLMGPRATSSYTLATNLSLTLDRILKWVFPARLSEHRSLLVLVSAIFGFLLGWMGKGFLARAMNVAGRSWLVTAFAGAYLVALLYSASQMAFDQIDNRLLSPIYLPLLIVGLLMVHSWWEEANTRWAGRNVIVLTLMVALLWIGVWGGSAVASVSNWRQHGAGGLNTDAWHESDLITYLAEHPTPSGAVVYSNAPWALRALAGILPAQLSPQKWWYQSTQTRVSLEELSDSWPAVTQTFLVWSDLQHSPNFYTVDELREIAELVLVVQLSDGAIYEISDSED